MLGKVRESGLKSRKTELIVVWKIADALSLVLDEATLTIVIRESIEISDNRKKTNRPQALRATISIAMAL